MKPLLIVLSILWLGGASAQPAPPFRDVPVDHWAGSAVERIADLGIVVGFPDGTFRGHEALDRYQASLVIDRLLTVLRQNPDLLATTEAGDEAWRAAVDELRDIVGEANVLLVGLERELARRRAATSPTSVSARPWRPPPSPSA